MPCCNHPAEYAKQQYRHDLLELKAPQDGIVKDIATHTIGTVISPGTILMTLVPKDEILRAEVWVSNEDVGFIHQGQPTKVKLASYQFQKYGMVDGEVAHLSADATENKPRFGAFRRRLTCASKLNAKRGRSHIHLGTRTILEYLLSPVMGAFQEAGRER